MGIKAAVGILTVLAILAGPANAQEMMVLTEESPPYNFTRDGRITGSSTEIVREILRRLGEPDGIQVLPWARSYKLLNSRPNVALFSTTRTPEREDRFFWIGPLFTVHYGFYARKSSHLRIDSLEDAKKVGSIATYKDDVKEQLLKSMGFVNL
ncbi:MAG: transporter substrate-binding domain-containing protein, partial [Desulfobacterales bacterium]